MHNSRRLVHNSRCGPRRALILGGPSHDSVGLFVSEGFSYKALVREPDARENRNATIDANAFRRAIAPVPVLLFGVTTLRVTCDDTWARRKALKSRQRAILVDLEGRAPHQRQYFRKFRHFDTTATCTILAVSFTTRAVGHAGR